MRVICRNEKKINFVCPNWPFHLSVTGRVPNALWYAVITTVLKRYLQLEFLVVLHVYYSFSPTWVVGAIATRWIHLIILLAIFAWNVQTFERSVRLPAACLSHSTPQFGSLTCFCLSFAHLNQTFQDDAWISWQMKNLHTGKAKWNLKKQNKKQTRCVIFCCLREANRGGISLRPPIFSSSFATTE